jgi:hypothetical protein
MTTNIYEIELRTEINNLAALLLEHDPPRMLSPHASADSAASIAKGLREGTWEASVSDVRGDGDNIRVTLRPVASSP